MQKLFVWSYKSTKFLKIKIFESLYPIINFIILYINGVKFSSFRIIGIPRVFISLGGEFIIGKNISLNNKIYSKNIQI